MPDENELDELTNGFLDAMISMKGVDCRGGKAESSEIVGFVAECCRADCIPGKDIYKD